MQVVVRRVVGRRILLHRDGLRQVYAEAFAEAPWHEDEAAADTYAAAGLRRPAAEGNGVAVLLGPRHPALGEIAAPI